MRKLITLALLGFLFSGFSQAKNATVIGKLVDSNDSSPLSGAYLFLQKEGASEKINAITDLDGNFTIKNVAPGNYLLNAHYVGYADFNKQIKVGDSNVDLKTLKLKFQSIALGGVEAVGVQARVALKGDTTEMNADAYKTNENATASDLIKKMPTVVVSNGTVQAQGENIAKVTVNGKEFFGTDPNAALANLPANIIQSVQIFDEESEQSKLLGTSNGNTTKTMNIVLRPGMDKGVFGKLVAGAGYENKYAASGNINIFNGDQRISIMALSNNVNVQNFSEEDLLGVNAVTSGGGGGGRRRGRGGNNSSNSFLVPQQSGIATTNAFGINYIDVLAQKVSVTASYFYNVSRNNNQTKTIQNYFNNSQVYYSLRDAQSTNANHRFNMKMDYKIDDNNLIRYISRFTLQKNKSVSELTSTLKDSTGLLNATDNESDANRTGIKFTNQLMFQHKFDKKGRTLVTNLSANFSPQDGTRNQYSLTNDYSTSPVTLDTLRQHAITNNHTKNYGASLSYTEPISENGMLVATYNYSKEQSESDKKTYDFSPLDYNYTVLDTALSNVYNNDFNTQSGELGYNFNTEKVQLNVEGQYQVSQLNGDQIFPYEGNINKTFNAFLPSLRFRYEFSNTKHLTFSYRTNTKNPSSNQLQNAVDNSNLLQLSTGNPNLNQQYGNSITLRYANISQDRTSILFSMISVSNANNYITSNSIYASRDTIIDGINVGKGAYLTRPENIDGYYNVRGFLAYGTPLTGIKSNLNLHANANWTKTPGLIDNQINNTTVTSFGLGLILSSNISENVDFTLGTTTSYSINASSMGSTDKTKYLNQSSFANLDYTMGAGLVLHTRLNHQYYGGYDASVKKNIFICNLGMGKKLFKDRAELSLNVYDLFKQNNSISQSTTDYYYQQQESLTLQRYVMLTFTYRINRFSNGSAPKPGENNYHHFGPRKGSNQGGPML